MAARLTVSNRRAKVLQHAGYTCEYPVGPPGRGHQLAPARPDPPRVTESGTGYFGSPAQQIMLNFRVRDLDAMLAQLRARGADVAGETQDMEGVGRFGWVTDPEGNRVELWQPA